MTDRCGSDKIDPRPRTGRSRALTASTTERRVGPTVPDTEDNREICFEQGKACVYEPEDEPGIIVTEWPNGVVDRHHIEEKTRIRHWPDGTTENRHEDDPVEYPVWPRHQQ